jgi:phosphoglycerol transferase MdoB-like AlkP superfamily enzyme
MQSDSQKQTTSPAVSDDLRAISAAMALCIFLWILKAYLIAWYVFSKGVHPLSDAPRDGVLWLGGADLLICGALAVFYRAIYVLRKAHKAIPIAIIWIVHIAMVIFAVVSMTVNQIYSWPLDIRHIRSADDPKIIGASLAAYAGVAPLALIVIGLLSLPLLSPLISRVARSVRCTSKALLLWPIFLIFCLGMFAMYGKRLRGIDTYGVKQNAVFYFATHYEPPLKPIDVPSEAKRLESEVISYDRELLESTSLHVREPLKRDFTTEGTGKGMNIILIQLESTSAAYLDEKTTPTLMKLASSGVSFAHHATVFSETTRATYAIYFSDYMTDLGSNARLIYQRPMPQPSLMRILKNAGYDTALFHSGFLSYADLRFMYEGQGIDKMIDASQLWGGKGELPWSWGVLEDTTVDALSKWIADHKSKPFFAIYASEFPHHPYECPIEDKPYPQTSWLNRYRNSLHYTDRAIGKLIDNLREQGVLDRTIIVCVGDHGETVSTYPVGHGLAMTPEELFTPFVISNPKLFPAAQHSPHTTTHHDIAPTILNLVGVESPKEFLGRNLLADSIPPRMSFISLKHSQVSGILDNGLLYIFEEPRNRSHLMDATSSPFAPLSPTDPRQSLLKDYDGLEKVFDKWAIWRHLARASNDQSRE